MGILVIPLSSAVRASNDRVVATTVSPGSWRGLFLSSTSAARNEDNYFLKRCASVS